MHKSSSLKPKSRFFKVCKRTSCKDARGPLMKKIDLLAEYLRPNFSFPGRCRPYQHDRQKILRRPPPHLLRQLFALRPPISFHDKRAITQDLSFPTSNVSTRLFLKSYVISHTSFLGLYAQPVHELHYSRRAPKLETPIKGLYLANMDSIYPWDQRDKLCRRTGKMCG